MAKVKVEVEVSKEASELANAVAGIVKATRVALKDGFQPGTDIPAVVVQALALLPDAIAGVDQMGAELAEDKGAFVLAFALAIDDMLKPV